jgi:hypothetical protein
VSESEAFLAALESTYGPASTWRRFRPEREAQRAQRERNEAARERQERGESPYADDQLPF